MFWQHWKFFSQFAKTLNGENKNELILESEYLGEMALQKLNDPNVNFKNIKWIKKITSMQTMIKGRWAKISLWLEAPVILSVNFETKLSPPFKQKKKYLISLNCDKHILKNNHKSAKILNVSFIVYKYIGICSIVWMTDIPVLVVQGGPFKTW